MNTPHVYYTADRGTVHLGKDFAVRTLCGHRIDQMVEGDETLSGVRSTCQQCRSIAHVDQAVAR